MNDAKKLILDRIWSSYELADTKRMKSFYYLFSTMAIFFILWLAKEKVVELPLIKTKVNMSIALSLYPMFILILTGRYCYLCSHSIKLLIYYLKIIKQYFKVELDELGIRENDTYKLFKRRDITENYNFLLFPIRHKNIYSETRLESLVYSMSYNLGNIVILLSLTIPISTYWISC